MQVNPIGWLGSRVVSVLNSRRRRAWVQIAVATLSDNSLRQTVHIHCASVHQAAKLVAALLRVAGVTAGLAESNGSLPPGLWLTSPAGWLPRTGISSGTRLSEIKYGLPLPFLNPTISHASRSCLAVVQLNAFSDRMIMPLCDSKPGAFLLHVVNAVCKLWFHQEGWLISWLMTTVDYQTCVKLLEIITTRF